jgi:hypothetical protein
MIRLPMGFFLFQKIKTARLVKSPDGLKTIRLFPSTRKENHPNLSQVPWYFLSRTPDTAGAAFF